MKTCTAILGTCFINSLSIIVLTEDLKGHKSSEHPEAAETEFYGTKVCLLK